jgi:opine dehydrogenase
VSGPTLAQALRNAKTTNVDDDGIEPFRVEWPIGENNILEEERMTPETRFAVLGGGNGGQSLAGDLAERGFHVTALYDRFSQAIEAVKERGGVELVGPVRSGFGKVDLVTSDIGEAVAAGDVLMVVVPAFAHEWMAEAMAPHLRDGQTVVLVPGYLGSTLLFRRIFDAQCVQARVTLAETVSLPYATRLVGPAQAGIKGIKKVLFFAALPKEETARVIEILKPALPQLIAVESVLATGLNVSNAIGHVPTYLLNLGRIEDDMPSGHFDWHNWATPRVKKVSEAIDRERVRVAQALGVPGYSKAELSQLQYAGEPWKIIQPTGDIPESSATVPPRYITEDVPHGLVPVALLGRLLAVPTPVTDSLIDLASTIDEVDYWQKGRTLEKLGLAGLAPDEIRALV